MAAAIVGDAGVAREVVQEAFARALVRWRRLQGYDRPEAWLRLVTVRLAVREASRRRRDGLGQVMPDPGSADHATDVDLQRAVAALTPSERAVIVLHYQCDLPVEEVARITRTRAGTVRVQLHRARQRLAVAMEVDDARAR